MLILLSILLVAVLVAQGWLWVCVRQRIDELDRNLQWRPRSDMHMQMHQDALKEVTERLEAVCAVYVATPPTPTAAFAVNGRQLLQQRLAARQTQAPAAPEPETKTDRICTTL